MEKKAANYRLRSYNADNEDTNGSSRIPRPISNLPKINENRLKKKSLKIGASSQKPEQLHPVTLAAPPPLQVQRDCRIQVVDLTRAGTETEVEDVDSSDIRDPQLCAEYVKDIYKFLRSLEECSHFVIKRDYLICQPVEMPRYRKILVDWLVGVSSHFHLLQETLFLSVDILDRYLQCATVSKKQLQLVGTTCLFVAAKYEEVYPPFVSDFAFMTDHTYSKQEIVDMEMKILKKLDYRLGKPLSMHFLRRYSKVGDADTREHNLAKYILECALHISSTTSIRPSLKAAAALHFSRSLLNTSEVIWPSLLTQYTQYCPRILVPTINVLKESLRIIHFQEGSHIKYTRNKYQKEKFHRVAQLKVLDQLKQ